MSKFKVVFAHFLSKFWLIFFWFWPCMVQYAETNSFSDELNNIFGFCSLFINFCSIMKIIVEKDKNSLFKSVEKTCIILMVSSQLSFLAYFESYSLRIKRKINKNLDKNWAQTTLNFDTFHLRLSDVKKTFKWLIRHKFLLRTTPSLIKRPIIQNPTHTSSSKNQVLHWNTLH